MKAGAPKVETMAEEMRASLVGRHGFFGRLALVQGPDRDEGVRNELLGGYVNLEEFMTSLMFIRLLLGQVRTGDSGVLLQEICGGK